MRQYDLGSEEGVLLMCVAEALLRIPDQDTADKLIRDKLGEADWKRHMGQSDSMLVNASTWGLMLTGHLVDLADDTKRDVHNAFKRLIGRIGEPVVRLAVRQAMRIMGHQFVMGRTIGEALARSRKGDNAALSLFVRHARRRRADHEGRAALPRRVPRGDRRDRHERAVRGTDVFAAPSISVKLSALHPRYELAKRARVMDELVAARARTRATREVPRHRLHHRRRGSRPSRTVARRHRRCVRRCLARRLGRLWPRRAGVPEARAVRDRLARRSRAPHRPPHSRCAWSRARTGTARSSARRSMARRATRCSRASRTPT